MKRLLLFFGNFLIAIIFGWDIMDYYFLDGINIINNDVNRVFIMWLGFTVTVISSCWFMVDHFKYLRPLLKQAKEMEKQQIIDGCNLQRNDYRGMPTYNKSGEQYYNETYKQPTP